MRIETTTALTLMILLAVSAHAVSAQTHASITSFVIRDGNTYTNRLAYDEWINNSQFRLEHSLGNGKYRITGLYGTDVLLYANNNELNNLTHRFRITGSQNTDYSTLSIAGSVRLLDYRELYAYYSATRYSLNGRYAYNPSLDRLYMLGFDITRDAYEEFEELDNVSYRFYGRLQRFFQSKLSFSGECGLGVKDYRNQWVIEYFGVGRYSEEPVKAAMFSAAANIGKSITSRTGVSLRLGGQWFIGDPIMAYSDGIYYYTENDLYDDPYSYQGPYVALQLTRQFTTYTRAKLGLKYQSKDYAGTPALNEIGELTGNTRDDLRSEYSLMISKKFDTGKRIPSSIDIFFNYMYRDNSSNDPYYEFQDHIGLIGFSVGI